jgi:hypothetical protein
MAEGIDKGTLPYAGPDAADEIRTRGKGAILFALSLVSIVLGLLICSALFSLLHLEHSASFGTKVLAMCFWALALAFLLSIPLSLVALAWCVVLLAKRPRAEKDYLAAAFVTLLVYFAVTFFILYQAAAGLSSLRGIH